MRKQTKMNNQHILKELNEPDLLDEGCIYYIEPSYHPKFHHYIKTRYQKIQDIARHRNLVFMYYDAFPLSNIQSYNYPNAQSTVGEQTSVAITKMLFERIGEPLPNKPALLTFQIDPRVSNEPNWTYITLDRPSDIIMETKRCYGLYIRCCEEIPYEYLYPKYKDEDADRDFERIAYKITKNVQENIEILRLFGYDRLLMELLHAQEDDSLSPMVITQDYRIMLPKYQREIKMSPLVKAVYFLFLLHPEGIRFKNLSEKRYYEELKTIYKQLSHRANLDTIQKSLKQIVDPLNNSINEKCSRIREAFVKEFTDSLAKNYYITGGRGEAKRIQLDRALVSWEHKIL